MPGVGLKGLKGEPGLSGLPGLPGELMALARQVRSNSLSRV